MSGFAYHFVRGKVSAIDREAAIRARGGFVWIHLDGIGDDQQAWLETAAHLPEIVVETLTATESRPRCDVFDHGAFLNLRGLTDAATTMSDPLASIRIWGSKGRVISATRTTLTAMAEVRRDFEAGEIADPGDLIAAFAVEITAELDPEVAELGDSLDDCELELDPNRVWDLRQSVNKVRARSIGYRRFLTPQRTALEKLANLDAAWLEDDDRIHLSAAADRAARMAEELESIRERAALMHDALTDLRAEQIDDRALLISAAAMVFLPLTFITGLYGMNVKGIWFAEEPWAFDAIAGVCLFIALGVTAWFVHQHWFKR
ncbi:MAG: CorA family divalent cation transporter [Pseudomonadota bacterium]